MSAKGRITNTECPLVELNTGISFGDGNVIQHMGVMVGNVIQHMVVMVGNVHTTHVGHGSKVIQHTALACHGTGLRALAQGSQLV